MENKLLKDLSFTIVSVAFLLSFKGSGISVVRLIFLPKLAQQGTFRVVKCLLVTNHVFKNYKQT